MRLCFVLSSGVEVCFSHKSLLFTHDIAITVWARSMNNILAFKAIQQLVQLECWEINFFSKIHAA